MVTKESLEIFEAASNNNLEDLEKLLEVEKVRIHAHADHNAALRIAAEKGYLRIVNALLKVGMVEENAYDSQLTSMEREMIGCGSHNIVLILAVMKNQVAVVKRLLEINSVREHAHEDYSLVLSKAVINGNLEIFELLLKIE